MKGTDKEEDKNEPNATPSSVVLLTTTALAAGLSNLATQVVS